MRRFLKTIVNRLITLITLITLWEGIASDSRKTLNSRTVKTFNCNCVANREILRSSLHLPEIKVVVYNKQATQSMLIA